MQVEQTDAFTDLLTDVMAYYGKDVSTFMVDVWWGACENFELEQVSTALQRHATDPDRGQFAPKVADIVKVLAGTTTDRAALAWGKALEAMTSVGAYTDVVFDDPGAACIRLHGAARADGATRGAYCSKGDWSRSMSNIVTIGSVTTAVISYKGQRVCTTQQLAQLYDTDDVRIQQNHARNTERFEEGKHFIKAAGEDLKNLRLSLSGLQISSKTRSLILWTERAAARHAKMLETDQAWEVFEQLEDSYFTAAT